MPLRSGGGLLYNAGTMKKRIPEIVVATILSGPAGQQKFAGVFAYLGAVHRWNLHVLRTQDEIVAFFADTAALSSIDGVIYSGYYDKATFKTLASLKCPVVVMEYTVKALASRKSNLMVLRNDADKIAKSAVEAFAGFGRYKSFAFVGTRDEHEWSERREAAFRRAVKAAGFGEIAAYATSGASAYKDRPLLEKFLKSLDYPAAILAANDARATEVIAAAKSAGISVPGKVSVLGIDNDPYICDSASPGISSIEPDFHEEGRMAASLLDKMLRSRTPKSPQHLFFDVKRVVLRESTPHLPPSENIVTRAKEFIARHATEGISPADVAAHLGISRTLLDLRFRETQKTTVGRLITDTKLAEVERRLRQTSLSIGSIQDMCGFSNANALKNLFKARYGVAMRTYRTQVSKSRT